MRSLRKALLVIAGSLCAALGITGIFVPVLPTTPLLLLAAFLFSRSSERLGAWLAGTKAYRAYVEPFKATGGIPRARKARILAVSFAVMALSGALVRRWYVWAVLLAVALFLLWLMCWRIPTVEPDAHREPNADREPQPALEP